MEGVQPNSYLLEGTTFPQSIQVESNGRIDDDFVQDLKDKESTSGGKIRSSA